MTVCVERGRADFDAIDGEHGNVFCDPGLRSWGHGVSHGDGLNRRLDAHQGARRHVDLWVNGEP